jgi:hypothetical protein
MRVLIVKGKDRHTIRLQQGLASCGVLIRTATKYEELTNHVYDMAFVDPSFEADISNKIRAHRLFFYDCEDSPTDFFPGTAYYTLKDKVLAYAKMNYIENDRNDGIQNIGFPISAYLNLQSVANYPQNFDNKFIPFFVGCPTYLGNHIQVAGGKYSSTQYVRCLAEHESGNIMYNQRYDWLLSLKQSNISYRGGIVFQEGNNLSLDFQSKYFGRVIDFKTNPMNYNDQLHGLIENKIGLCPTGHERLSWRNYDIMATGAILIRTDHKKQLALINPKEYITIKDGEDLGTTLLEIEKNYTELYKAHQTNRDIFKTLDQKKLITLFTDQLR